MQMINYILKLLTLFLNKPFSKKKKKIKFKKHENDKIYPMF